MKNNAKRWIAVGLAVLVLVASMFMKDTSEEKEAKGLAYLRNWGKSTLFDQEVIQGTNPAEKIRKISLEGVIQGDENSEFVISELKDAAKDPTTKGVILAVNSPGGSVYVSEKIAKEIKNLKAKKIPVYSVMEEMAASGGYYISAPTDRIYASNETLTGSIGVIMGGRSFQGLFEKYGIKEQNVVSGKMKDTGTMGRDLNAEEKAYLQGLVDSAFGRFVKIVSEGRHMSEKDVRKLADGRVYDGAQAVKNGLVDKIGDIDMAIADMTKENKLNDPQVVESSYANISLRQLFQKVGDLKKSSSDLAILKELMEENRQAPMYIYGGVYGR